MRFLFFIALASMISSNYTFANEGAGVIEYRMKCSGRLDIDDTTSIELSGSKRASDDMVIFDIPLNTEVTLFDYRNENNPHKNHKVTVTNERFFDKADRAQLMVQIHVGDRNKGGRSQIIRPKSPLGSNSFEYLEADHGLMNSLLQFRCERI